ncbi:LysM peptidoglycan-binding domain-containing protein [Acinetobacter guillouiae]|uniref:LysM peptidoglycan-binding domain-containing protein n=1 Tax=Acinetobacter guillouiae TaxID=106649 RepID=UPI003AF50475
MTNTRKSLITIKVVDLFGSPISKLEYQVKNQRNGEVIAAGPTNSAGCIVEISRDKGTVIDVYIKNMFTGTMVKVQSLVMSKDRMLVKIMSPKVLLDLKTLLDKGSEGQYKRKTHTVKKGETLTSIASQNQTTVRALERLNKIDDPNKISIGQVIKLPVDIPAAGSNSHQDKPKPKPKPKATTAPKPKVPQTQTSKNPTKTDTGILGTLGDLGNKALEQANDLYEEGKKTFNGAVGSVTKILTVDDRSQDGGTPKSNVPNLCKTNPQCIDKGNSELIREVNIRLAGFGGALPTDEFTELTAKCIKQFQKDYMGIQPTGKICGSFLSALDKFYYEYPVKDFMAKVVCPCSLCSGFGNNIKGVVSGKSTANEYPGIHRSLIWILKALNFYLKTEFKEKKLDVAYIESGYRCTKRNKQQDRTSVNHMGLALDIHFNKNGKRTRELADMEFIRKSVLSTKMGASEVRKKNQIYLEPKTFSDGTAGARTWVHYDITYFENKYFNDIFFKKNTQDLNGNMLVAIAQSSNNLNILSCSGLVNVPKVETNLTDQLILTNDDILNIMKVTETEVIKFKTETYFQQQAAGVVDTIMNRVKSGVWGSSVSSVANAHRQFSKMTGPANLEPYGSVQNMPASAVSARIRNFVNQYLIERANGKKSIIGQNLNYANKYYSDSKNRKQWVDAFHDEAVKKGMILGTGKAIHAHGTVSELKGKMPKPFAVILPKDFKGI